MNDPLAMKLFWLCIAVMTVLILMEISYRQGQNNPNKQAICKPQTLKAFNQDAGQYINEIA